ncbi:hypothetical protein [Polynucleobacter necessarius]|uniref:hypothetical protein n=1 Tax=Polynucleobacter necessarius TaxID=576610 RepID=UPI002F95669E
MFWVGDGESLWQQKLGPQNKSCSSCHGDVKKSMPALAYASKDLLAWSALIAFQSQSPGVRP